MWGRAVDCVILLSLQEHLQEESTRYCPSALGSQIAGGLCVASILIDFRTFKQSCGLMLSISLVISHNNADNHIYRHQFSALSSPQLEIHPNWTHICLEHFALLTRKPLYMNICDDEMLVLSENEKKLEQEYEAMKKSGASSEQLWSKANELYKANEACNNYASKHTSAYSS